MAVAGDPVREVDYLYDECFVAAVVEEVESGVDESWSVNKSHTFNVTSPSSTM